MFRNRSCKDVPTELGWPGKIESSEEEEEEEEKKKISEFFILIRAVAKRIGRGKNKDQYRVCSTVTAVHYYKKKKKNRKEKVVVVVGVGVQ